MAVTDFVKQTLQFVAGRYHALTRMADESTTSLAIRAEEDAIPEETAPLTVEEAMFPPAVGCFFGEEEENDYTSGPAKMVVVNDGANASAALLLSYDLSKKIQDAVMGDRVLQELGLQIDQQRSNINAREQDLRYTILRIDRKIERLELKFKKASKLTDEQVRETEEHRAAISDLEKQRADLELEDHDLRERWEAAQQRQQMLQREVNVIMEDVFVKCQLLPPQESFDGSQMEPFDGEGSDQFPDAPEGLEFENHLGEIPQAQNVTDDYQDVAMQASTNLEHRKGDLIRAQRSFDTYQTGYDASLQQYLSTQINRPIIDSQTEHDLLHLQRGRTLTRRLIDAEEALEAAEIAAKAARCPTNYFQESHFGDGTDDGYRESQEAAIAAQVDRKKIEAWLAKEPANGDMRRPSEAKTEPEVDEWSVDEEKPFDSVSVLAEGSRRKKIDKWRRRTGAY
ncbi:hypothetical protein BU16DRAFT_566047 [Lophium mytilinum]|uniref:Uncharacterized protein n=1 Tax=Lophium mytilinum TaxID=390894 RepID=A0A6A6QGH0_9PEZI|nr:hypothetical protein BU16DRAFT_566047 [Lophium mytilinum]